MLRTYKRKSTSTQAIELTKDNLQKVVDYFSKEFQKYTFILDEDKVVFYNTQEKTTKHTLLVGDFIAVQDENDIYPIKKENFDNIYIRDSDYLTQLIIETITRLVEEAKENNYKALMLDNNLIAQLEDNLPQDQKDLLKTQLDLMKQLDIILKKRLELINKK